MTDAEQTLRDLIDKILDQKNYASRKVTVDAITSDGANYTSSLFLVKISSPDRDDLKLFAKVACIGGVMRAPMHAEWLYRTEINTYTKLAKIYEAIQDEHKVPVEHRYVFPKFYGCNAELEKETVVMEDLVEVGYKSFNRFKTMDWEHASKAVETLAKFHALSFAYEKYHPEQFKELIPNLISPWHDDDNVPNEMKEAFWTKAVENALQTVKEDQRDAVRRFALNNNSLSMFTRPFGKPVITHGDYRLSNLLFRRNNDVLEAICVDYQTVQAGCPACDLIYFIFLGSDEEFRSKYYTQLIDHYYSSLEQALEKLSVETSVYSRETFDSDMKKSLPYALLIGVLILPLVTVEAGAAPKVDGHADVNEFIMKPSELYAQRFSGIVNDCIRWGVI